MIYLVGVQMQTVMHAIDVVVVSEGKMVESLIEVHVVERKTMVGQSRLMESHTVIHPSKIAERLLMICKVVESQAMVFATSFCALESQVETLDYEAWEMEEDWIAAAESPLSYV